MIKKVVILTLTLVLAMATYGETKTEKIKKMISGKESASVKLLKVNNIMGPVTVEGYSGRDIVVEVNQKLSGDTAKDLKKAESEVEFIIERNGDTLDVKVDGPFRNHHCCCKCKSGCITKRNYRFFHKINVKIPKNTDIDVRTVTKGNIKIDNIRGNFYVNHVNGEVDMTKIDGSGTAKTVSGTVNVDFVKNPMKPCHMSTISGKINLRFPKPPDADFSFKSMTGEVLSDFDYKYMGTKTEKKKGRKDMKFRYISKRSTQVRIGKGGPAIDLSTLSGDIILSKRK